MLKFSLRRSLVNICRKSVQFQHFATLYRSFSLPFPLFPAGRSLSCSKAITGLPRLTRMLPLSSSMPSWEPKSSLGSISTCWPKPTRAWLTTSCATTSQWVYSILGTIQPWCFLNSLNECAPFALQKPSDDKVFLSGYGVELAIKNQEYKAKDDTQVQGLILFVFFLS